MKKNNMMRLASVLLVLVLLTTCAISGTFAKYTSTANGSDAARVAYWGFGKDTNMTINLFSTSYDGTVLSADTDKVIAPGTEKETTIKFAFKSNVNDTIAAPEVDYIFDVAAASTGSNTTDLDNNANFKWTLKVGTGAEVEYDTLADLVAAINALEVNPTPVDGKATNYYKAGTLPAAFSEGVSVTIGWAWEYEDATDALDTSMGNEDPLENVAISIVITATQQD